MNYELNVLYRVDTSLAQQDDFEQSLPAEITHQINDGVKRLVTCIKGERKAGHVFYELKIAKNKLDDIVSLCKASPYVLRYLLQPSSPPTSKYKLQLPEFKPLIVSKLAEIEIADKDYTEGGKKYFTSEEALEVEKKMEGTGWRLPTRHEWVLICEEFANGENGVLSPELLEEKLGLGKHGRYNFEDSRLYYSGDYANYWSRSGESSTTAFRLVFSASYVYPSYNSPRYYGFSLRLVRDLD